MFGQQSGLEKLNKVNKLSTLFSVLARINFKKVNKNGNKRI